MNRREVIKRTALLMGGAISAPAIMAILKGCKASPVADWKPQYFTEEQALVITVLADIMIPATDTSGAKEIGVPAFIEKMIHEVYSPEKRDAFTAGLVAFMKEGESKYKNSFVDLEPAQQVEFTKQVHDTAIPSDQKDNRPFILKVKELTLLGFFSSKVGATQVLQYESVPGHYFGCKPLDEVGGKTWAS